jgi:hypothetical protein
MKILHSRVMADSLYLHLRDTARETYTSVILTGLTKDASQKGVIIGRRHGRP